MTKEQRFLIKILKGFINEKKPSRPSEALDWNSILTLSEAHQVGGIVYKQCKDYMPIEVSDAFKQLFASDCFSYSNRKTITDRLFAEFSNIDAFLVKGLEVAALYPVPALRTMCDCDIVIFPGQLMSAVEVMRNAGFTNMKEADSHTWLCEKNGFEYEVHDTLTKDYEYANNQQQEFFNGFVPYVKHQHLDWSFHFLFLLAHLRKHLVRHGAGFRQFMDLAIVMKNVPDLSWDWIEASLDQLSLTKFGHACYSLVEAWFGVRVPVQYTKLDQRYIDIATEKIFDNGVFGFNDPDNQSNIAMMELSLVAGPMWLRRIRRLCQRLFPSYSEMKNYPQCGFIIEKPFLLPLAWCRRLLYMAVDKNRRERKKTLKDTFMSSGEFDERRVFFDIMGL